MQQLKQKQQEDIETTQKNQLSDQVSWGQTEGGINKTIMMIMKLNWIFDERSFYFYFFYIQNS